jgi:hypothetical protein
VEQRIDANSASTRLQPAHGHPSTSPTAALGCLRTIPPYIPAVSCRPFPLREMAPVATRYSGADVTAPVMPCWATRPMHVSRDPLPRSPSALGDGDAVAAWNEPRASSFHHSFDEDRETPTRMATAPGITWAPPAGFEPALPPPEGETGRCWLMLVGAAKCL